MKNLLVGIALAFSFIIMFVFSGQIMSVSADVGSSWSSAPKVKLGTTYYETLTSGDVDMWHYEVPYGQSGAYNFYTTGSTDTYGYVYEHQGVWPFDYYEERGHNDDSGEGRNFRIELDLDNYEDYFVKVRGYSSSTTGSYYIKAEPNKDKIYAPDGGIWESYSRYNTVDHFNFKSEYLSLDGTALYLHYLNGEKDAIDIYEAYALYGGTTALGIAAACYPPLTLTATIIGIVVGAASLVDSLPGEYEEIIDLCDVTVITDSDGKKTFEPAKPLKIAYHDPRNGDNYYTLYYAYTGDYIYGTLRARGTFELN